VPLDLGYGGNSPVIHALQDMVCSEGMPTQLPSCGKVAPSPGEVGYPNPTGIGGTLRMGQE
jgi:hypothetical protein